jgi:transcriptional regulator with XRE-family HTH domain
VDESQDLRLILSRNIRAARGDLHLSQAKLAEYSGISLPYLIDIEHCKTWVSDKTLKNIALALNMEVYQLFIPDEDRPPLDAVEKGDTGFLKDKIAAIIDEKNFKLKKNTENILKDLTLEILRLYPRQPPAGRENP